MDKEIKPIRISASVLDDTFYVIEYATSENAKETAYEKIKRLIMNEPITLEKEASEGAKELDFFTVVREYGVPLEDCREGGTHEYKQTVFRCEGR